MKLEIVSHCWNYSRLLTYQLSSLVLYPPRATCVTMTVFLTQEDMATVRIVEYFTKIPVPPNIAIRSWYLPMERLVIRGIGRNLAGLATDADWVWFADCDYVFGPDALDALASCVRGTDTPLAFPRTVFGSRSHAEGDEAILKASGEPRPQAVRFEDFLPQRMSRAIGGIQICRGDVARQRGYLKDAAFQQITFPRWRRTREDAWFRRDLGTRGEPIHLPCVFRIRHSHRGQQAPGIKL